MKVLAVQINPGVLALKAGTGDFLQVDGLCTAILEKCMPVPILGFHQGCERDG